MIQSKPLNMFKMHSFRENENFIKMYSNAIRNIFSFFPLISTSQNCAYGTACTTYIVRERVVCILCIFPKKNEKHT